MAVQPASAGWASYFEEHYSEQIAPVQTESNMWGMEQKGLLTDAEYVQCVSDAYLVYQTIQIADVASYVAEGHLTADQYQTITGQVYTA